MVAVHARDPSSGDVHGDLPPGPAGRLVGRVPPGKEAPALRPRTEPVPVGVMIRRLGPGLLERLEDVLEPAPSPVGSRGVSRSRSPRRVVAVGGEVEPGAGSVLILGGIGHHRGGHRGRLPGEEHARVKRRARAVARRDEGWCSAPLMGGGAGSIQPADSPPLLLVYCARDGFTRLLNSSMVLQMCSRAMVV